MRRQFLAVVQRIEQLLGEFRRESGASRPISAIACWKNSSRASHAENGNTIDLTTPCGQSFHVDIPDSCDAGALRRPQVGDVLLMAQSVCFGLGEPDQIALVEDDLVGVEGEQFLRRTVVERRSYHGCRVEESLGLRPQDRRDLEPYDARRIG